MSVVDEVWEFVAENKELNRCSRVNTPGDQVVFSDESQARLAAQAPAMARLLLELQFGDHGDCLDCGGDRSIGHKSTCEIATTLRAAGVL